MTQDGTEVTCSTCVHYRHTNGKRTGLCRRFPPAVPRPDGDTWRQPVVDWDDTCGEWRQRRDAVISNAGFSNCGHGHVFKSQDGSVAKCGGPNVCKLCARDLAQLDDVLPHALDRRLGNRAAIEFLAPPSPSDPSSATSGHPDAAGRPARSSEDEVM